MGFDCNTKKKRRFGDQRSEENESKFVVQMVVETRKWRSLARDCEEKI
jgi:hypothetical protein